MQPIKRTARVTKERDVRVNGELWHTSCVLLDHGQQRREGSTHQFRASLVFTAFALEAYLNWLGHKQVPNWNQWLTPRAKIELLAKRLSIKVDYNTRPWSIVTALFGFRNKIAHGKPEVLKEATLEPFDADLDQKLGIVLTTEWEQFCTEENAIRTREDVRGIAESLHAAAHFDNVESTDPFSMGFQLHGATLE